MDTELEARRGGRQRAAVPREARRLARRIFTAVLLGYQLAAALPLQAATWYVNSNGGSDLNGGTSPADAWQTITKANTVVANGDIINLAASTATYTGTPGVLGTTWIGDSVAYQKVRLAASAGISVINLTLNGITMPGIYESTTATGLHMRNCLVRGDWAVPANYVRVDQCYIGDDSTVSSFIYRPTSASRYGLVLRNSTLKLGRNQMETPTPGYYPFALASGVASDTLTVNGAQVTGNHITITSTLTGAADSSYSDFHYDVKLTMIYRIVNCVFQNNYWDYRDSCADCPTKQGFLTRDRVRFNLWDTDTVIARSVGSGVGDISIDFMGSGNTGGNCAGIAGGVPDSCTSWANSWRRLFVKQGTAGRLTFERGLGPWDSLSYSAFACTTYANSMGFTLGSPWQPGPSVVFRNTFLHRGQKGGALTVACTDPNNDWKGKLVLRQNIAYSRDSDVSYGDAAIIYNLRTVPSLMDIDYNLGFAQGSTNGYWKYGACGGPGVDYVSRTFLCNTYNAECHSIAKTPKLTDSSFANFNPELAAGSFADNAGQDGCDIGARDFGGACTGTPLVAISTLNEQHLGTDYVQVKWTVPTPATGCVVQEYDLRYSTSAISSGNFSSATRWMPGGGQISIFPAAGVTQYELVGTPDGGVLTDDTPYWFALKYRDQAGTWSPISNVLNVRTLALPPGTVEP